MRFFEVPVGAGARLAFFALVAIGGVLPLVRAGHGGRRIANHARMEIPGREKPAANRTPLPGRQLQVVRREYGNAASILGRPPRMGTTLLEASGRRRI